MTSYSKNVREPQSDVNQYPEWHLHSYEPTLFKHVAKIRPADGVPDPSTFKFSLHMSKSTHSSTS